jgi:hypothetical protein
MGTEFRIEVGSEIDRAAALASLKNCEFARLPQERFRDGQVWLSTALAPDYPDVRLFPADYGFFVEVTALNADLAGFVGSWIAELKRQGRCDLINNDTDEVEDSIW